MQHYTREIHKAREEGLSCMIQMLGGAGCLASRVCFGLRGSVLESATHGHWLKISHINMYTSLQNKGDSKSSAVHTSVTSVHVLKLLGQNPGLSRPSLADFVLTNRERFVFRLRCQSQVPQRRRHVDKKSKAAVPCLFSEESPEIKLHQTLVNPIELNIQEPSNILEGDVRIGGIHRSTSKSPPFRGRSTESRPTAAPDVDLRSRPARARAHVRRLRREATLGEGLVLLRWPVPDFQFGAPKLANRPSGRCRVLPSLLHGSGSLESGTDRVIEDSVNRKAQ